MVDLERLNRNKEGILSALRFNGPSLPARISKIVGLSPLFTAAFLSELKAERKVKVSNMKVGSSPIYFLEGQEERLEEFVKYLNQREREAFELLKKEKILSDEAQTPVVRVALRAIKDFAIPVKIRVGGELKLFWKYFLVDDAEVEGLVRGLFKGIGRKIKEERKEVVKEERKDRVLSGEGREEKVESVEKKEGEKVQEVLVKNKPKKKTGEFEFGKKVRDYLTGRDIEVLEILADKKKEFVAKVRVDGIFGKQCYYLISKDKKTVSDNDLVVGFQKAQSEKLPALVMCKGELSKKAKGYIKEWGNLIKFEKLNFS